MPQDRQTALQFADRVATLAVHDPLAELLGALEPGQAFHYTYEDAVKLCGHSCPTVARAWLMTIAAVRELYGDRVPVRGEIEVVIGGDPRDGSTGPASRVVELLTGAAPESGFGGLAGHCRRRDLLRFDPALEGRMRFRRTDTGATVEVELDRGAIPAEPDLPDAMRAALAPQATVEQRRRFAELWQRRVEGLLTGAAARAVRVQRLGDAA